MRVRILGSCAGGGLPQWNCGGANSLRARAGVADVPPRTQSSIAVSADDARWPITGPDSSLATLAEMPGRTLYIHMNNTNPVLDAGSPETARVARAGVEIAADGQEFELHRDS